MRAENEIRTAPDGAITYVRIGDRIECHAAHGGDKSGAGMWRRRYPGSLCLTTAPDRPDYWKTFPIAGDTKPVYRWHAF